MMEEENKDTMGQPAEEGAEKPEGMDPMAPKPEEEAPEGDGANQPM